MTTKKRTLAQEEDFPQTADVLPEGRRPQGETSAAAPQTTPTDIADVQVKVPRRSSRRKFSTDYKLKILEAYDACDNALARGALLRKEALYSSRISTWKKQLHNGRSVTKKTPKSILLHQQQEREIAALKKKLAQAEAIIDIQKKVSQLLSLNVLNHEESETKS
ncbi:MAG: hypothetical protein KIT80_24120 [Chitinophagaceae bacterium]|nr:hypothetical protein [Legionellales bacterium]MCW5930025.1 hypothetical protein [Chitinophagaceae bacterium]